MRMRNLRVLERGGHSAQKAVVLFVVCASSVGKSD